MALACDAYVLTNYPSIPTSYLMRCRSLQSMLIGLNLLYNPGLLLPRLPGPAEIRVLAFSFLLFYYAFALVENVGIDAVYEWQPMGEGGARHLLTDCGHRLGLLVV